MLFLNNLRMLCAPLTIRETVMYEQEKNLPAQKNTRPAYTLPAFATK